MISLNFKFNVVTYSRLECSESCKMRRKDSENDMKQLRRDLKMREEQFRMLEREVQVSHLWIAISRSSQCSTTGVTKAVVCVILSVGWCI